MDPTWAVHNSCVPPPAAGQLHCGQPMQNKEDAAGAAALDREIARLKGELRARFDLLSSRVDASMHSSAAAAANNTVSPDVSVIGAQTPARRTDSVFAPLSGRDRSTGSGAPSVSRHTGADTLVLPRGSSPASRRGSAHATAAAATAVSFAESPRRRGSTLYHGDAATTTTTSTAAGAAAAPIHTSYVSAPPPLHAAAALPTPLQHGTGYRTSVFQNQAGQHREHDTDRLLRVHPYGTATDASSLINASAQSEERLRAVEASTNAVSHGLHVLKIEHGSRIEQLHLGLEQLERRLGADESLFHLNEELVKSRQAHDRRSVHGRRRSSSRRRSSKQRGGDGSGYSDDASGSDSDGGSGRLRDSVRTVRRELRHVARQVTEHEAVLQAMQAVQQTQQHGEVVEDEADNAATAAAKQQQRQAAEVEAKLDTLRDNLERGLDALRSTVETSHSVLERSATSTRAEFDAMVEAQKETMRQMHEEQASIVLQHLNQAKQDKLQQQQQRGRRDRHSRRRHQQRRRGSSSSDSGSGSGSRDSDSDGDDSSSGHGSGDEEVRGGRSRRRTRRQQQSKRRHGPRSASLPATSRAAGVGTTPDQLVEQVQQHLLQFQKLLHKQQVDALTQLGRRVSSLESGLAAVQASTDQRVKAVERRVGAAVDLAASHDAEIRNVKKLLADTLCVFTSSVGAGDRRDSSSSSGCGDTLDSAAAATSSSSAAGSITAFQRALLAHLAVPRPTASLDDSTEFIKQLDSAQPSMRPYS